MIIDNSERPMRKAHNVFLSSPTIHYTTQKKHGPLTFSKKKGRRRRRSTDSDWPLSVFLLFENLPAAAMAAARLLPLLRRRLAAVISDSPVPSSRGIWIHQLLYPSPTVSLSKYLGCWVLPSCVCFYSCPAGGAIYGRRVLRSINWGFVGALCYAVHQTAGLCLGCLCALFKGFGFDS
jgi:hypothetical protein